MPARSIDQPEPDLPRYQWQGTVEASPRMLEQHDTARGVPVRDERELFEFLILEGAQAGLAWITILRKREGYRHAFHGFDPERIARFTEADQQRLRLDPGIVRNRLKIDAVIHNARVIRGLRARCGGFATWLRDHHPRDKARWVRLFRETFRFTGGEITGEFLASIGYLPSPHRPDCPVHAKLLALAPPWTDREPSAPD